MVAAEIGIACSRACLAKARRILLERRAGSLRKTLGWASVQEWPLTAEPGR